MKQAHDRMNDMCQYIRLLINSIEVNCSRKIS